MSMQSFGNMTYQPYVIGGGGGSSLPCPFDPEYDENGKLSKLSRCMVMFGRRRIGNWSTMNVPTGSGVLCAKIVHPTSDSGGYTLELAYDTTGGSPQSGYSLVPLYQVNENGAITADYRLVPVVPVYN